ncbi:flagellar hook-length control protein FliK [Phenylobacterium sp.]|uniref:flagellar hook-length control protein FliK n=1 Tax=Phenylobacterium sp. TaxID=1871053 RepID=UPI00272F84EC|nr:flagellar hook-length control protein FliK [Phenylobacterium sp.]MDP1988491.1 flagellar hook-length control protein FliK [Phenylobacterium sp.]
MAATSATVADLAAQVSRKLQGRNTHFDIQLTPEGLGRVDVRVDIDSQGKLTAAMAFDNPHAAAELRGRAGDLQRALEQAGFDISGGLSFQSPQDGRGGGQFADQAPDREAWQGRAFQNALGVADEAETAAVAARLYQQRRSPTGVDLRI